MDEVTLHDLTKRGAAGPCTACFMPTDKVLTLFGTVEWVVAALVAMDVPMDEAEATLRVAYGQLPAGRQQWNLGICQPCADKIHMQTHLSTDRHVMAYPEPDPPGTEGSYPPGTVIDPDRN